MDQLESLSAIVASTDHIPSDSSGPRTPFAHSPTAPAEIDHVILLIHGIRTEASWQEMVADALHDGPSTIVVPLRYGYFTVFRFWFPFGRGAAVEKVLNRIRAAKERYAGSRISVVAHSFGTHAIGSILQNNPDIKLFRLVLCGSVLPTEFRWDLLSGRVASDVINDCGTRDIWPVFARSTTWGFGASGTFGFGNIGVRDRFHDYSHGDFFERKFVQTYWRPYFRNGEVIPTPWEVARPPTSWWISVLGLLPLKYVITAMILLGGVMSLKVVQHVFFPSKHENIQSGVFDAVSLELRPITASHGGGAAATKDLNALHSDAANLLRRSSVPSGSNVADVDAYNGVQALSGGRYKEAGELFRKAAVSRLESLRRSRPEDRSDSASSKLLQEYVHGARAFFLGGEYNLAAECYTSALHIIGDAKSNDQTLCVLGRGNCYLRLAISGPRGRAIDQIMKARRDYEEIQPTGLSSPIDGTVQNNLGVALFLQFRYTEETSRKEYLTAARKALSEALVSPTLSHRDSNTIAANAALFEIVAAGLEKTYASQSAIRTAIAQLEHIYQVFTNEQSYHFAAAARDNIGVAYRELAELTRNSSDLEAALGAHRKALELFRQSGSHHELAETLYYIARVYELQCNQSVDSERAVQLVNTLRDLESETNKLAAGRDSAIWIGVQHSLRASFRRLGTFERDSQSCVRPPENALAAKRGELRALRLLIEANPSEPAYYRDAANICHDVLYEYEDAYELRSKHRREARGGFELQDHLDYVEACFTTGRLEECTREAVAVASRPTISEKERLIARFFLASARVFRGGDAVSTAEIQSVQNDAGKLSEGKRLQWTWCGTKSFVESNLGNDIRRLVLLVLTALAAHTTAATDNGASVVRPPESLL